MKRLLGAVTDCVWKVSFIWPLAAVELRQSFRLRFEAGDGAKPCRQHLFVRWFAVDGIGTNIEYGGEPLRAQKFGDWIRQPAVFRTNQTTFA